MTVASERLELLTYPCRDCALPDYSQGTTLCPQLSSRVLFRNDEVSGQATPTYSQAIIFTLLTATWAMQERFEKAVSGVSPVKHPTPHRPHLATLALYRR